MRSCILFFAIIAGANASLYYRPSASTTRQEIRTSDGVLRGTFTYIDGEGKFQTLTYGGGENDTGGSSSPTLPEPVPYTPEVAAARAAHFAARDQAIYLQQLAAGQGHLLNRQILEYPYYFRDYYGAARHLRSVYPYYYF